MSPARRHRDRVVPWIGTLTLLCAGALTAAPIATREAVGHAGRLLATGGASTIEGSAGGGLVPWAVIAGYGTEDQWGGAAFATRVEVRDYALSSQGVALGWRNRVEIGVARQRFDIFDGVARSAAGAKGRAAYVNSIGAMVDGFDAVGEVLGRSQQLQPVVVA